MPAKPRFTRVLGLIFSLLATSAAISAEEPQSSPAPVVFVCEHGSVKSLMAASYFNRAAQKRGLTLRAIARGVNPDEAVPGKIARSLADEGFDVWDFKPARVSAPDVESAAHLVTIGVPAASIPAAGSSKAEQWDDIPAASVDYSAASKALQRHVDQLLDRIQAEKD